MSEVIELLNKVKEETSLLVRKRATIKGEVTKLLNSLEDVTLSDSFVNLQIDKIRSKLIKIEEYDSQVIDVYLKLEIDTRCKERFEEVLNRHTEYIFNVDKRIATLQCSTSKVSTPKPDKNEAEKSLIEELGRIIKNKQPRIQELKLPQFSGSKEDCLQFSDFLNQFNDNVGKKDELYSDSTKLLYLKGCLKSPALDLIKHLSNEDDNYKSAIKFLVNEYYDKDVIIDKHIQIIMQLKHPDANDFDSMRSFFNKARISIYELGNLGYGCLTTDSLGNRMVSFILMEKLPTTFKSRLSILLQTDHPTTDQLLNNYSDVIKSLEKASASYTSSKEKSKSTHPTRPPVKPTNETQNAGRHSTLQNFNTHSNLQNEPVNRSMKLCKLCHKDHSMLKCSTYATADMRIRRLRQLKLCENCTGKHQLAECPAQQTGLTYPCTSCGSNRHITAVCKQDKSSSRDNSIKNSQNHMCIISNHANCETQTLIPSTSIIVCGADGSAELVRCMIDPGSQSSYISRRLSRKLRLPDDLPNKKYNIRTFTGTSAKTYPIASLDVVVSPESKIKAEFLIDKDFNLDYTVPGIYQVIQNLKNRNKFADCFFDDIEDDHLTNFDCLLGADLMQNISPLSTIKLGQGIAYKVADGIILFGDIKNYVPDMELTFLVNGKSG